MIKYLIVLPSYDIFIFLQVRISWYKYLWKCVNHQLMWSPWHSHWHNSFPFLNDCCCLVMDNVFFHLRWWVVTNDNYLFPVPGDKLSLPGVTTVYTSPDTIHSWCHQPYHYCSLGKAKELKYIFLEHSGKHRMVLQWGWSVYYSIRTTCPQIKAKCMFPN